MSAGPNHRGFVVASIFTAVALSGGMLAVIGLASDRTAAPVNGPYGAFACPAPTLLGVTVSVQVADAGDMMMSRSPMRATLAATPPTVPSGRVSFAAFNTGVLVHELVVLPLPADGPGTRLTGTDGKIDESELLGEASRSCRAGVGDGIAPGSIGWTTVDLKAGRYELVCDEPWHYAAGMFNILTVT